MRRSTLKLPCAGAAEISVLPVACAGKFRSCQPRAPNDFCVRPRRAGVEKFSSIPPRASRNSFAAALCSRLFYLRFLLVRVSFQVPALAAVPRVPRNRAPVQCTHRSSSSAWALVVVPVNRSSSSILARLSRAARSAGNRSSSSTWALVLIPVDRSSSSILARLSRAARSAGKILKLPPTRTPGIWKLPGIRTGEILQAPATGTGRIWNLPAAGGGQRAPVSHGAL